MQAPGVLVLAVHSALYATPTTLIELLNALSIYSALLLKRDTRESVQRVDVQFYGKDKNFTFCDLPPFLFIYHAS